MSACVKYWYFPRRCSGMSTYSMHGSLPIAAKTARARSFHVRAFPVPQLNSPPASRCSPSHSIMSTASFT